MKKLLFLLLPFSAFSQYFQQDVSYQIEVKLDDKNHFLSGFETLTYKNNSPQTLTEIYMHVWPNAYKNKETALAQQLKRNEGNKLAKADPKDLGYIDSLDFKVNGAAVQWSYTPEHQDIVVLKLASPLKSGEAIQISTPFKVKIPSGSLSRLGHIGQSYQITQWYPKPAVYDQNGWNAMPYLNQGEFYSEFGSFDVKITVPANYVVGATGELQTASEIAYLNQKVEESKKKLEKLLNTETERSKTFPESASEWKTLQYKQDRVHDFAWFADKRFLVLKGEVVLPHSKETVTTWAMFTPQNAKLWANALEYLHDGTYYYSLWNGDYPYKHVTAIDGTISAGGGMEYPMITVIGNSSSKEELEVVIVHEVGHNWFYGILGSNERVHGWMDEGLNTLNEMRYVQTKYPDNTRFSDMVAGGRFHLNDLDHHDSGDITYRTLASFGLDQPLETHSDDFSSLNYGAIMYQKTGVVFFYLMDYLGAEKFDAAMSAYYQQWKFKHPQPADLQKTLETQTGKDLSWLFKDLIQTTKHLDYKIKGVHTAHSGTTVDLSNKGQVNGPIGVSLLQNGQVLETKWAEPGQTSLSFITPFNDIDKVVIDNGNNIPELKRQNNLWVKDQVFKKVEPLRFELLFGDHEKNSSTIFWTPMLGGNAYDGLMAGVTLHNIGLAPKKFTYLVSPMLSTARLRPAGIAEFSYQILPTKAIELMRLGLSLKSFGTQRDAANSYFVAFNPYVSINFGDRKARHAFHHDLLIQGIYKKNILGNNISYNDQGIFVQHITNYKKPVYQAQWTNRYEYFKTGEEFVSRIWTNLNQNFNYSVGKMDRNVTLNLFGGYTFNHQYSNLSGDRFFWAMNGLQGQQDLFLEDYNFGRSDVSGIWSQQRMDRHGQFHTGNAAGSNINWLTTATVYAQLPIKPNLVGVFADFGAGRGTFQTVDMYYNAGMALRLGKVFGVYFPLVYGSNNISGDLFTNYAQNIRFTLRINPVNRLSLHTLLNS
ncbi:MAG: M1 family metallopeptidase [Crocinitomicaceae bacterium]|nr:M1 family metallopeptidase [Crocinitomicaceae bacterium]